MSSKVNCQRFKWSPKYQNVELKASINLACFPLEREATPLKVYICMFVRHFVQRETTNLTFNLMAFFVQSFFSRDVLDDIWNLIGSVSESFPTNFFICFLDNISLPK